MRADRCYLSSPMSMVVSFSLSVSMCVYGRVDGPVPHLMHVLVDGGVLYFVHVHVHGLVLSLSMSTCIWS